MKRFLLFTLCIAQYTCGASTSTAPAQNSSNQQQNPLQIAQERYSAQQKNLVSAQNILRTYETELQTLLSSNPTKKSSDFAKNQSLINEANRLVATTKQRVEQAKIAVRNAKTVAHISTFQPRTQEYCDLKHAEYLAAQEVIDQYQKELIRKEELINNYSICRKIAGYISYPIHCLYKPVPDAFLPLLETKKTRTLQNYNRAKQNFSPAAYVVEKQAEYDEARENLRNIQKRLQTVQLLFETTVRNNLDLFEPYPENNTSAAGNLLIEDLEAKYRQARETVENKHTELEEAVNTAFETAMTSTNTCAQSSITVVAQSAVPSIFHTNYAPGTEGHYRQSVIRFLGAFNLQRSISSEIARQNEIARRNAAINQSWFTNGAVDWKDSEAYFLYLRHARSVTEQALRNKKIAKKKSAEPEESAPFRSPFYQKTRILLDNIEHFLHPILHGHAEPIQVDDFSKIWITVKKCYSLLLKGELIAAKHILDEANYSKPIIDSIIEGVSFMASRFFSEKFSPVAIYGTTRKTLEKFARYYSVHTAEKSRTGSSSDQAMLDAKNNKIPIFSTTWNEQIECPHGIERCPLLGMHSKATLAATNVFINNITAAEKRKQRPFFPGAHDVHQIISTLDTAITNIYESNIKSALTKQACDDKAIKNTRTIIEAFAVLPTEFYNIEAKMIENEAEIRKLLANYSLEDRNRFYAWMRDLRRKALNPNYGYSANDTGANTILIGPPGVGKTHISTKLCELLGLPVIHMTLQELLDQTMAGKTASEILKTGALSPLEQKLISLPKDVSSLLFIIHIDEADKEDLSKSTLKRHLCQFKNLYLPSLQIHLPTKLNILLTCNRAKFIENDPALAGRFNVFHHTELTIEAKINRFLPKVVDFFENDPILKHLAKGLNLEQITEQYVLFDPTIDMRLLESRLSCIADYFTTPTELEAGHSFLFPTEYQEGYRETFPEFLASTFKTQSFKTKKASSASEQNKKKQKSRAHKKTGIPTCSSRLDDEEESFFQELPTDDRKMAALSDSATSDNFTTEESSRELSSSSSGDSYNDHDTD